MEQKNNEKRSGIEEELTRQIKEFDRHADRVGWPLLIAGLLIFFMLVYIFVSLFSIPTAEEYSLSQEAVAENISELESRIEDLESQVQALQE